MNVSINLDINDESSNFQSNKNMIVKKQMENEWLTIFPKWNELYKNLIKYPTVFKRWKLSI